MDMPLDSGINSSQIENSDKNLLSPAHGKKEGYVLVTEAECTRDRTFCLCHKHCKLGRIDLRQVSPAGSRERRSGGARGRGGAFIKAPPIGARACCGPRNDSPEARPKKNDPENAKLDPVAGAIVERVRRRYRLSLREQPRTAPIALVDCCRGPAGNETQFDEVVTRLYRPREQTADGLGTNVDVVSRRSLAVVQLLK
ncbi:hypothetical protein EVAR_12812_1 [Eumeta japonica]|uniref:Uncharacterized protein n=1 Tax=Eumeta variegata TaxID=151549 RepID=A0A4C1UAV9_EUMVA|nr:hypothetical protein EVAR_12812_1 [Eumeta japonica]